MFKQILTPQDANKRLPLIRTIVKDILEKGRALRALIDAVDSQSIPQDALTFEQEINDLVGELEALGCYYKDWRFEVGMVDFPSVINGQNVFLCWRADEDHVLWFHPVDGSYEDRQPIPEHLLIQKV